MEKLLHKHRTLFVFCVCIFVLIHTSSALAVIIAAGDGTGNTSAPGDDPGFAYVGMRGDGTGVYLGNNWVLTAFHVGPGSIVLDGNTYTAVLGSEVRLQQPDSTPTDLILYKINSGPSWTPLTISTTAPVSNTVTMIGGGRNRALSSTSWDANWQDPPVDPVAFTGYKWAAGRTVRWGQNVVDATTSVPDIGFGPFEAIVTSFSNPGGKPFEAQAATGDSGGAVFHKNGSNWELAGIMLAINSFVGPPNQPGETSVFGNNTFSADLSVYHNQILAVVPEPAAAILAIAAVGGLYALRRRQNYKPAV